MEGEKMKIKIYWKDGRIDTWGKKEFTDYQYDGKCFIIIRKLQWVGIYNLDEIAAVVITGGKKK